MSVIAAPNVRPSIPEARVTPDDLLQMEERGLFELVDSRLVEKKMSYLANEVAGKIAWALNNYLHTRKMIGSVLPEQSFQCFVHKPSQVRRPDIAYIAPQHVPAERPAGHVKIVPDLAVEVISPGDNVYELDEKLADYREAGFPLVWVVNPDSRIVRVHRPGQPIIELRDGEALREETVLPEFAVNVTDLFPPVAIKAV